MRFLGLVIAALAVALTGALLVGGDHATAPTPTRVADSALPTVDQLLRNHGHLHPTVSSTIPGLKVEGVHQVVRVGEAGLLEAVAGQVVVRVKGDGAQALRTVNEVASRHGLDVVMTNLPGFFLLRDDARGDLAATIAALRAEAALASVEPDYVALVAADGCCHSPFHTAAEGDLSAHNQAPFDAMHVAEAWQRGLGSSNVLVAVLDTGVTLDHPDLHASIENGYDFVNRDADPTDDSGHGTAMAALIAADGSNGQGITGVAQGVRVLPVKVADGQGRASLSDIAQGIQYAVGHGARVLLLSLGSRAGSEVLRAAVEDALAHGAVIVASEGNENVHEALYPAAYPGVLSVAGTSQDGSGLALSTSLSRRTDLAAPAEGLMSAVPNGWYREVSGTSASAALVAGGAALALSRNPSLDGAALAGILRASRRPIALVESMGAWFDFGLLDVADAVKRAESGLADPSVARVTCVPRRPLPGQQAQLEIEVVNGGAVAAEATLSVGHAAATGGTGGAVSQTIALAAGERRTVVVPVTGPGSYTVGVASSSDSVSGNDAATIDVPAGETSGAEFEVVDIATSQAAGTETFDVAVRNVGNAAGTAAITGSVDGKGIGGQAPALGVGETGVARFLWSVPSPTPEGTLTFLADGGSVRAYHQFVISRTPDQAVAQYQQSGDIDLDADAPFRVDPGRLYVPLMVFVPDKGSSDVSTALWLDHTVMTLKNDPSDAAPGTTLYEDTYTAAPTTVPAGLVVVDEDGQPVLTNGQPDANLFRDQPLTVSGHHAILRVPRAAFGILSQPSLPMKRFVDCSIDWSFRRLVGGQWTIVRTGRQRTCVCIRFSNRVWPRLAGEGHMYDGHLHTMAEWYHTDSLETFAPMKAYGCPLQMLGECAYAQGMIDSVNDWNGKVTTSDHNCFYSAMTDARGGVDQNSPLRRPPVGPTSPARSVDPRTGQVTNEFDRMRQLFGDSTGEEVGFSQNIWHSGIPVPIGAHMLAYRGTHVEGMWHGGSVVSQFLGEGAPLELDTVINNFATTNGAENVDAFCYAAHPYSGQGWEDATVDATIGVGAFQRTRRYVSSFANEFVFKGFQLYNGRSSRFLPTDQIDFTNMNPWANPTFANGTANGDSELQITLTKYHHYLSRVLDYSFNGAEGDHFIHKIYVMGGTDAHGDFNFSVGRLAALLNLQATFTVNDSAFGNCLSYVLSDGKPGATPQERWMNALADGNLVVTDGPVASFEMDSDGKWDAQNLVWHDGSTTFENADGQMGGGGGGFDGQRTMLVRRGATSSMFRYRWNSSEEFGTNGGAVTSIHIYKDEAGRQNPTFARAYGARTIDQTRAAGRLAPLSAGQDHVEAINPSEEGTVNRVSAIQIAAYTGGDPDVANLGPDEGRCYSNPVWAAPVDIVTTIAPGSIQGGGIQPGGMTVELRFDLTMSPDPIVLEVKQLDASGNSTSGQTAGTTLAAGTWSAAYGVNNSVYRASNATVVPLSTATAYPSAGLATYVVFTRTAPRDMYANALNTVATTVTAEMPGFGTPTAPRIVSTANLRTTVGEPYQYDADGMVTAYGSTPITFSLPTAPPGMTVDSLGRVSWTPATTGMFWVGIRATNFVGTNDQMFMVTVDPNVNPPSAPVLAAPVDGTRTIGNAVSLSWGASSGPGPITYRWAVAASGTPDYDTNYLFRGQTTSTSSGPIATLDGTSYVWNVRATNANGSATSATRGLRENAGPVAPSAAVLPTDGASRTASASQTLTWNAGSDGDGDAITYYWQVGRTNPPADPLTASGAANGTVSSAFATAAGATYYWRVSSYDGYEMSAWSPVFRFDVVGATPGRQAGFAVGLGDAGNNGWIVTFGGQSQRYGVPQWKQAPWAAYDAANGETRIATGDVDGDGKDELLVGFGRYTAAGGWAMVLDDAAANYALLGWVRVPDAAYNAANGETWPACGDLDGDGRDELVLGLGASSASQGRFFVFDDRAANFAYRATGQVAWSAYNAVSGETRPACGDYDGDGRDEIAIGFGRFPQAGGWIDIRDDLAGGLAHVGWQRVDWTAYNSANGETWPAMADLDGNGVAEVVAGLGRYTTMGGYVRVGLGSLSYTGPRWIRVANAAYDAANGETRPTMGDFDGDGLPEFAVGVGAGGGGAVYVYNDARNACAFVQTVTVPWSAYNTANGETRPAGGFLR